MTLFNGVSLTCPKVVVLAHVLSTWADTLASSEFGYNVQLEQANAVVNLSLGYRKCAYPLESKVCCRKDQLVSQV
jgi:hypothetical protein